ncbi:MAG: hypothetical protein RL095_2670 [Verrucomicrobiota bacterium]|jgi:hypothetical protein
MKLLRISACVALLSLSSACSSLNSSKAALGLDTTRHLFNGNNLDNWEGDTQAFVIVDGSELRVKTGVTAGNLYSKETFSDFLLTFEFKLEAGGHSGIALRSAPPGGDSQSGDAGSSSKAMELFRAYDPAAAAGRGDLSQSAMEINLIDDYFPEYADLREWQYSGSLVGVKAARRGSLQPAGKWNTCTIQVKGRQIAVMINSVVICESNLDMDIAEGNFARGKNRRSGHIALSAPSRGITFRNILVKDL